MKLITFKEIIITITINYIVFSYVNKNFNPFELSIETRGFQIALIGLYLFMQAMIKDLSK